VDLPEHQTLQDDIAAILGVLITQPGLLIIDNFETALDKDQIIADAAMSQFIEQLLNMREKLKSFVIITSINPFRTTTRLRPPQYSIPGISRDFAIEYLTNESRGWSAEEAERIYNIRLGNPHAMRLASSEIRDFLGHGFSFDDAYAQLAPEIVKLTYGISYDKLTQSERLAVEALALHPSGLPLDAVEFVLRNLDFHGSVIQLLMQLYSKEAISSTGTRWFSVLPQNRQYVYERADKIHLLHKAAMEYYQHLSSDGDSATNANQDQVSALVFFHSLRAKEIKCAFDAFSSLRWKPETFGFPSTLATMGVQLKDHDLFYTLSASDRGHVFQYNGRLFRHLGEIEVASRHFEQALSMFQEANYPILSASVLCDLGLDMRKQGQYTRELEFYDNALSLLGGNTTPDALQTRSAILGRKGQALQRKGVDPSLVFACLNEALTLARQIDDRLLIVTRLGMLGTAYRELGKRDMESAIRCFTEAVRVSKNTEGHPELEAATAGLAKTYEKARNHQAALDLYLKALKLTKETDTFGMLDRLGTLGHVHKSLGRFNESETYYKRALDLSRKVGNRKAEAENLDEFGSLCRIRATSTNDSVKKSELLDVALECHRTAVQIQDGLQGDPAEQANRYQELGRTLFALDSLSEARSCFVNAIFCAREAHRSHLEAWQFLRLGDVLGALGRGQQSVLCYTQAIRLSPQEMAHLKETAKKAFEALPPDLRKDVMSSMKDLDDAIQMIVME
jgi:tetratricopeptide (TPR) repeat protein